ncbi:MAG TPA: hypothetical protein VI854_09020, partial [Acidimicrobiia bacterium]|nr:hypothetical protein [Acidimicrobiia bacterium]
MITRRRRPLILLLALLAATVPVAPAEALYAPHDSVVSADPADGTPHVLDGKVTTILPLGNRVYVGGTFTQVQEEGADRPVLTRQGLFAFDPATGAVDSGFVADFDISPDPADDRAVETLVPSPDGPWIFVGGSFGLLNGTTARKVVKLHTATGGRDPGFNVAVHSPVKDLAVTGNRLILAGNFTSVNSQERLGLAAVNVGSGGLDPNLAVPFTVPRRGAVPRVETIAVSPDG